MKYNCYVLTTALLILFHTSLAGQNIIRGPYLQLNTPSGIIIRWRTDVATQSKVWYGNSPAGLSSTEALTGSRTEHEVHLAGLSANTKYYYAVGHDAAQLAGADENHFFNTSPIAGTVQPVSIWVLGDAGKNKEGNVEQREVRDAFYNYNGGPHADLILALGDNACEDGLDWEFQTAWFEDMYEASIINSPTWSTIGNHEVNSADSEQETGAYYEIFNLPKNGEAGGVPSGTEAYYSFDYANIHFVCLNTEDVDQTPNGAMYAWLQADLAANEQEWLIAFFHRQPYYDSAPMRSIFLPLLESAGLDLAMFGHKHAYQRSPLINGHYEGITYYDENTMAIDAGDGRVNGDGPYLKPLGLTPNAGAVYMQSGSAGSGGSPNDYPVMPFMASGDPEGVGSVHIAVNGAQLEATFISKDGHVYDHFSIYKQTGTAPMVAITSPADGARYENIQTIDITADASDPDGQVTEVEFFVNDISIGTDALPPYRFSWTPPAEDFYAIHAVVRDDEDNERTSSTIQIRVGIPPAGALEVSVANENDDAEEDLHTGHVSLTSSDLELGYELLTPQLVGIRFGEVDLQPGSRITEAYIQFYLDEVSSETTELTIFGEDADNAAPFVSEDFNISSRPQTGASATWRPTSWDEGETNDPDQRTVDISTIVEEIAGRPGWQPQNAMVFLISGQGTRIAESYDGSFAGAPVLHIEYNNTVTPCPEAGNPCDDGNDCTENDVIDADCNCAGTPMDADGDGVCDNYDICPGFDDNSDADSDGLPDGCDDCPYSPTDDSDNDGVCDDVDICIGGDDSVDTDRDGVPDACDSCPNANPDDSDGDGVCDDVDICIGGDDSVDTDRDGVPDFCDSCPNANPDDSDGDGVCDDVDICIGGDDSVDTDRDGVPDACDLCLGDDASGDMDQDGICDDIDNCPETYNPLQSDTDGDGVGDACVGTWMLSLVVYLQGAYDPGTGLMRDDLRSSRLLPLDEPYTSLGYPQIGGGGGEQAQQNVFDIEGANAIVDWVFLELRSRSAPTIARATRSALLQADGDVVDVDGISPVEFADLPVDAYYVIVRHRNHVGIMSAMPIAMSDGSATVDFTRNPNAIYDVNGISYLEGGKLGLVSGDCSHNNQVQNTDYTQVISTLGMAGYSTGDFDLNGQVQNTDLQLCLLPNIGRGAAFP